MCKNWLLKNKSKAFQIEQFGCKKAYWTLELDVVHLPGIQGRDEVENKSMDQITSILWYMLQSLYFIFQLYRSFLK